jgi:Transposase DDE domain
VGGTPLSRVGSGKEVARRGVSGMLDGAESFQPCQEEAVTYHREAVYQWTAAVRTHLPCLSEAQVRVLALWSLGMVLARSCGLTAVAAVLAAWQRRRENTVRQQLREFCYAAEAKAGARRREVAVEACFAPLLRWALAGYAGRQLALALDATTLGSRFVVLACSVVYRGCAIPVAWAVLPAGAKRAWRDEWPRLLGQLAPAVPPAWTVIVLADRGLYARWLFQAIVQQGWHPFLRVKLGGTFRPAGLARFYPLRHFVPTVGQRWQGRGAAFATNRLDCTLLAYWADGCAEPWLVVTDLPPAAADAGWYGLRAWIEQGFKLTKRGGWQWQRTRMTDPARAGRLWLAVAVATLWLVRVGGEADAGLPEGTLPPLDPALLARRRQRRATRLREVGLFRRGWALILAALLEHQPLPTGAFRPEAWPSLPANPALPRAA